MKFNGRDYDKSLDIELEVKGVEPLRCQVFGEVSYGVTFAGPKGMIMLKGTDEELAMLRDSLNVVLKGGWLRQ